MNSNGTLRRDVNIFIASPCDVSVERDRANLVVNELNRGIANSLGVTLQLIQWESHVAPLMGRPEQVVLDQVFFNDWDVFVGIVWLRFGTPTGEVSTLTENDFQSGTEEEFVIAYDLWKKTSKPNILFYRCTRPPSEVTDLNIVQYQKVDAFFKQFSHDGKHPGLVARYLSPDDFERRFREDLLRVLRNAAPTSTPIIKGPSLPQSHLDEGFLAMYLPSMNKSRMTAKNEALKKTHTISLMAHSGYSFLALISHRYRAIIEDRLCQGGVFRLILTNPWSDIGVFIALGEYEIGDDPLIDDLVKSGNINKLNAVQLIESTNWYSIKLKDSLSGYERMRKKYKDKIEIKFCMYEMPASVLLTDQDCFFEPYISVDLQERLKNEMLSYDLQVNSSSHLYRHCKSFFDLYWKISEPCDSFLENEQEYKTSLSMRYNK